MDVRLRTPFSLMAVGPSNCGKTQWTKTLLEQGRTIMTNYSDRIIWCYSEFQPAYIEIGKQFPQIEFIEGIPADVDVMFDPKENILIIFDDLMAECSGDMKITSLFSRGCHHRNLNIIMIVQNLFYQGKESRTISLNTHYMVLFKNPRDRSQIVHLAKQMFPGNVNFMRESYENATERPYGYLFVDLRSETPENLRLRTNIFEHETPHYVYVPKKYHK